jgi:hypothetical protein
MDVKTSEEGLRKITGAFTEYLEGYSNGDVPLLIFLHAI